MIRVLYSVYDSTDEEYSNCVGTYNNYKEIVDFMKMKNDCMIVKYKEFDEFGFEKESNED